MLIIPYLAEIYNRKIKKGNNFGILDRNGVWDCMFCTKSGIGTHLSILKQYE